MSSDVDLVIVFESHATSVDNEAGLASGWFDVALSAVGEEQARQLGARRGDDDFAVVFCSDLTRAWRTAEIAFRDRGLPIVRDARLRECDYGTHTRSPVPDLDARRGRHVTTPFPGGESYEQVVHRVEAWLSDTMRTCADRRVLVIGHRATFYALEHLLGHRPLEDTIAAPWHWQPGWTYRATGRDQSLR